VARSLSFLAIVAVLTQACGSGTLRNLESAEPRDGSTGAPSGTAPDSSNTTIAPEGSAFAAEPGVVKLLPFDRRLRKLAFVIDVPPEDAIFDGLVARRLDLGASDYARGVAPAPSWTASKVAIWSELMLPLCESTPLRSRFPDLPAELDPFFEAAYGRAPLNEDREALAPIVEGDFSADDRYTLTCLAILSSVEFVSL